MGIGRGRGRGIASEPVSAVYGTLFSAIETLSDLEIMLVEKKWSDIITLFESRKLQNIVDYSEEIGSVTNKCLKVISEKVSDFG